MKKIYSIMLCLAALSLLAACEGDHQVIETDWSTLESIELQKHYNKYMDGDWVYQYEDSVSFIEMYYKFSTKDSTVLGYYNELIRTNLSSDGMPEHDEWQLLWQGEFTAKWVLLHSVDLNQAYIYLGDLKYENVHGVLANYDVLAGRVLFYGATRNTLSVTTPITFRRIDMHHPKSQTGV